MLIINADDFGRTRVATDRIIAVYRHGAVTSTSTMVFMEDSERAAELAKETGIDTGLHLNFTQRFTRQGRTPRAVEQQEQIVRFLKRNKFANFFTIRGCGGSFVPSFRRNSRNSASLWKSAIALRRTPPHAFVCQHAVRRDNSYWREGSPEFFFLPRAKSTG